MNRNLLMTIPIALSLLLGWPAPHAGAIHDECFDDAVPGTLVQEGFPTTSPPSHYKITDRGFEVTIGPSSVGTFHVEVNGNEVSFYARDPLGQSILTVQAGNDISGGTIAGHEYEAQTCIFVPSLPGRSFAVDVDDPDPTRPGRTVRVLQCAGGAIWTCITVVGHTGAEIDLGVPLNSCLWVDGRQQNVLVSCPPTDPGSGLPL